MRDPIVIEPPDFDIDAAWKECGEWVDKCGGMVDENGEGNYKAASGADPGVMKCPACGAWYWRWGTKVKCIDCDCEFDV